MHIRYAPGQLEEMMLRLSRKLIGVSLFVASAIAVTSCTAIAVLTQKLELQSSPSFVYSEQLAHMPAKAGKLIQFELLGVGGSGDGMPRGTWWLGLLRTDLVDSIQRLPINAPLTSKLILTYTVRLRNTTNKEVIVHLKGSAVECENGQFYTEFATKSRIVNSMPSSDQKRNFNGAEDKLFGVPDGVVKLAPLESRDIDGKTLVYMPDEEYPPRPKRLFLEFGFGSEKVIVAKECTSVVYGL